MRIRRHESRGTQAGPETSRRTFLRRAVVVGAGAAAGGALFEGRVAQGALASTSATLRELAIGDFALVAATVDTVDGSRLDLTLKGGDGLTVDTAADDFYSVWNPPNGWQQGQELVVEVTKDSDGDLRAVGLNVHTRAYITTVTAVRESWLTCSGSTIFVYPADLAGLEDAAGWTAVTSTSELRAGDTVWVRSIWDPNLDAERAWLVARAT